MRDTDTTMGAEKWVGWIWTMVISSVTAVLFLFNTFVTVKRFEDYKNEQNEVSTAISKRLERIENKLDQDIKRHHG